MNTALSVVSHEHCADRNELAAKLPNGSLSFLVFLIAVCALTGGVTAYADTSIYDPHCITNLAGLAGSSGTLNGTTTAARFSEPWGLAVDGVGTVYVADTQNHVIRKITPVGIVTTLAGSGSAGFADGAAGTAQFNRPTGVAVNSSGTAVYVADYDNHRIRMIDLTQLPASLTYVSTVAGVGTIGTLDGPGASAQFRNPFGVALNSAGSLLYVSDQNNQTIRKITLPGGVVSTHAGSPNANGYVNAANASARFNTPRGIAVDGAGDVYVADSGNFTVRKISGGNVTTLAGHPTLAFQSGFNDGPANGARFSLVNDMSPFGAPTGVAVDGSGHVYVADQGNHLIRRIDQNLPSTDPNFVTTLAGAAGLTGSTDGLGIAVRFNYPAGVAADSAGRIYVADTLNHTIRVECCLPARVKVALYAGLMIEGSVGCQYQIEYTTFLNPTPSLTVWIPLVTLTLPSSPFLYVDTSAPASNNRFYRVVVL